MQRPGLALRSLLEDRFPETQRFFERADGDLEGTPGLSFRALFASVPRRLGTASALTLGPLSPELLATRPHCTLTDYVRLWLMMQALSKVSAAEKAAWLLQLFEAGEMGEQVSILRMLPLLPEAARFLETGVQACRTNARDVFEAIVCENPFLVDHFPPLNFNQAIMKAIFMEVPLDRIERLEQRITPELSRMAAGYASERRAAGRPVPNDAEFLARYGAP
ncbi:MAG TPA: EboA domain-containing protein [Polyangiaceae bacterium]